MQSGKLSDLLVFEKKTVTGTGESYTTTWLEDFREWSEAQRLSETSARFIIRYRSGITPASHRILWDDARWTIVNVIHDRRSTMLSIDADISNLVESTDLNSETTEYLDAVPVLRPPSS